MTIKRTIDSNETTAPSSINNLIKQKLEDNDRMINEESEEKDQVGPSLPETQIKKRKKRTLDHEQTFLDNLPSSESYERSLMHRDNVNFVHCTPYSISFNSIYLILSDTIHFNA